MASKRSRQILEEERTYFELTGEPNWRKIIKQLTKSDLNQLCRLILPTKQVENYILPFIFSEENRHKVNTDEGLQVTIIDEQCGSEHYLRFKKWASSKSYVIVSNWNQEFVIRRGLQENDWIQMYWSKYKQCFFFSVLTPQQVQQQQLQPRRRRMNVADDRLQLAVILQEQQQYPLQVQPLQSIPPVEVSTTDDRSQQQLHHPPQLLPLMDVVDIEDERIPQLLHLMEGIDSDDERIPPNKKRHPPRLLHLMEGIDGDDERIPLMDVINNERLQRQPQLYPPNKKQKSTASCLFPNRVDDKTTGDELNLELTL